MAPKKKLGVNRWDEELARRAALSAAIEESALSGGNFIRTRGGRLTYNGAEVPGNKMNVVILDHILENHWYKSKFDPKKPGSPHCFAFARTLKELAPHEKASEPQGGEGGTCTGCPMNEFGTADTGRGKACGNSRRLAVIAEGDLEDVENAEIALVSVPVTSCKGWAGYVTQLNDTLHKPPFAVVTELSLEQDDDVQYRMIFKMVYSIEDDDQMSALVPKSDAAAAMIETPYPEPQEAAPEPAPATAPARKNKFAAPAPAPPTKGKATRK